MQKNSVFDRLRAIIDHLKGKDRIGKLDLGVLQTMMMLAAMDGDISDKEISAFKEMASGCRGYDSASFQALFESTLRSAGYLLVLTRFLDHDALVAAFVREAEKPFTVPVARESTEDRTCAVGCLVRLAEADGDFSKIERDCIDALAKRVEDEHTFFVEARNAALSDYAPFCPRV